jgi:hypothetical protein
MPERKKAKAKTSNDPRDWMEQATIPEDMGAPEARAIPRQSGSATKKTTKED